MNERAKRILSDQYAELSGSGMPTIVALTTASPTYQMKATDHVVIATSAAADDAGIVTLPSLAEAIGGIYSIQAPTGASAGDISVYEKETGAEYAGQDSDDGDLDADNDNIVIFSNGLKWVTLHNGVA